MKDTGGYSKSYSKYASVEMKTLEVNSTETILNLSTSWAGPSWAITTASISMDNNTLREIYKDSRAPSIVGIVMCSLLLLFGFLGNILLILSILTLKGLRKKENALICSLAVNNAFYLIFHCPIVMYVYVKNYKIWDIGLVPCLITRWLLFTGFGSLCICHIIAITVIRLIMVIRPSFYIRINTKTFNLWLIVGIYAAMLLATFGGTFLPSYRRQDELVFDGNFMFCKNRNEKANRGIGVLAFYGAVLLIIGGLYCVIYKKVQNTSRAVQSKTNVKLTNPNSREKHVLKQDNEMTSEGMKRDSKKQSDFIEDELENTEMTTQNKATKLSFNTASKQDGELKEDHTAKVKSTMKVKGINIKREAKIAQTTAIILLAYFILYIPWPIILELDIRGKVTSEWYIMPAIMMYIASFCVNWILYGAMNKNFRRAYMKMLGSKSSLAIEPTGINHTDYRTNYNSS